MGRCTGSTGLKSVRGAVWGNGDESGVGTCGGGVSGEVSGEASGEASGRENDGDGERRSGGRGVCQEICHGGAPHDDYQGYFLHCMTGGASFQVNGGVHYGGARWNGAGGHH